MLLALLDEIIHPIDDPERTEGTADPPTDSKRVVAESGIAAQARWAEHGSPAGPSALASTTARSGSQEVHVNAEAAPDGRRADRRQEADPSQSFGRLLLPLDTTRALAQVRPAPKAISSTRSPSRIRPSARVSSKAMGMLAELVLP